MQRVMIVTGGSQGIGAAIARLAGARGYAVALTYQSIADPRRGGRRGHRRAAAGAPSRCRRRWPTRPRSWRCSVAWTPSFGPVTVLVNNAGTPGPAGRIDAITAAVLDEVLAVNVRAPFLLIREAAARMATDRGGAGGAIVNISSRAAELGGANEWIQYAASKGALDSLTIGAAKELGPRGIRVNAVSPGLIETESARPFRPARPAGAPAAWRADGPRRQRGGGGAGGAVAGLGRGVLYQRCDRADLGGAVMDPGNDVAAITGRAW